jgi:hypothetical protein
VRRADELAALLTTRPAVLVTRPGEPIRRAIQRRGIRG